MKKLSALVALALFLSFSGVLTAQATKTEAPKKEVKKEVVKKVKKDKCCDSKKECSEAEKKECKDKKENAEKK